MHRIIKAHLDSYVKSYALERDDESIQFEKFVNFSVLSSICSDEIDINNVTTSVSDDGIDGVAVIIDEKIITSEEDARNIFDSPRRNHDVTIIFLQAKRSENFDLGDFLKFKDSVLRFINQTQHTYNDEILIGAREVFDIAVSEVTKIRHGKPSLIARFVTTGVYQAPVALETALRDFHTQLQALGYFVEIDVKILGRDELTALWVSTYSASEASLQLHGQAALPTISGIDEAYLAIVKASDFVTNLLITDEGNLKTQVFEENVRSFLGLENPVNQSIADTLSSTDSASRFPVLNNGITIVSPDVRLQGNTLHLTNYQIVNGCQTSNVLFANRNQLGNTMVNIKVVETQDENVFAELVRATNSQTKVENNQFLSLKPIIKRIEQFFNTYSNDNRLYFERRDRQYFGQNIPAVRIFSLDSATKSVAAMFYNRPELAGRYPKVIYEELSEKIFSEDTKEIVFYAACLTYYRFVMLISNSSIPQNMSRFKWHILTIVRALICGKSIQPLNSRAIEESSEKIIKKMAEHNPETTGIFVKASEICQNMGQITRDHLKRQSILQEMLSQIPNS